jgi:cytoskeleton protein RodZ
VIGAVVFEWQRERSDAARLSFVPVAQAPLEPLRLAAASPVAMKPPNPAPLQSVEAAEGNRRIVLKFERSSWVEIRGRDGKTLISQLNPAGSEQRVEGRPPFSLIIGNAQHVRLSYEDRQIDLAPHVKVEVARFTLD